MSHMQSKTWKGALMGSVSLLAFGVPMARPGALFSDMWKPAYSDAALNYVDATTEHSGPVYPDAKKL